MKARHIAKIGRCRCGSRFVALTQQGQWYWCLHCDAHVTDCKAKGLAGWCACQWIKGKAA